MVSTLSRRRMPCVLPGLLLTLALAAQAQAQAQPPSPARPDPLDPKAQVPTLRYESSFATFRRIGDDKPVDWREANDAVARIGGWRVYAREAQQPGLAAGEASPPGPSPVQAPVQSAMPAPAPVATPEPAPAGHSDHKH